MKFLVHYIPAVDSDGMVASSPLNLGHFLHNTTDRVEFPTAPIRGPVGDLKLTHLMCWLAILMTHHEEERGKRLIQHTLLVEQHIHTHILEQYWQCVS